MLGPPAYYLGYIRGTHGAFCMYTQVPGLGANIRVPKGDLEKGTMFGSFLLTYEPKIIVDHKTFGFIKVKRQNKSAHNFGVKITITEKLAGGHVMANLD